MTPARISSILVAVVLLATGVIAEAQQQTKVAKIGILSFRSASALAPGRDLLRRELRAFGYAEGKNIVFEIRSAEGKFDRFPALAEELVRLNVDIFVASSTAEARAVKNATKTIPIVFYNVDDPIAAGLIDSLARPGDNITGVTSISSILAGKRLELSKKLFPNSHESQYSGIRRMKALLAVGKKANFRREDWVYKFIPWR